MSAPILVLDAWGVLYQPGDDVAAYLIPFVAAQGGTRDRAVVQARYAEASLGQITAQAFWQAVGVDPALEDEYLARVPVTPGLHAFLREAATQFRGLACLSNDVAEWSRKVRARHGLDALIPTWVLSGDLGVRKPAPAIYRALLERIGVPADQVLFVDDRLPNLDAARALGLRTVWMRPQGERGEGHPAVDRLEGLLAFVDGSR